MADSLQNAEVIGGIAVEIGSNLAGLRAGVAEAKTLATATEKQVKVSIPVSLDTSKINAQVSALAQQLKAVSGNLGIGTASAGFSGGVSAIVSEQKKNHDKWIADEKDFQQFIADQRRSERVGRRDRLQRVRDEFLATGEEDGDGDKSGSGSGGAGFKGRNPFSAAGLGRALGVGFGLLAVQEAAQLGTKLEDANNISSRPNMNVLMAGGSSHDAMLASQTEGQEARLKAIESVPVVGALTGLMDAALGVSQKLDLLAQGVVAATEATQRAKAGVYGGRASFASATGDPEKAIEADTAAQRMQINLEKFRLNTLHDTTGANVDAGLAALDSQDTLAKATQQEKLYWLGVAQGAENTNASLQGASLGSDERLSQLGVVGLSAGLSDKEVAERRDLQFKQQELALQQSQNARRAAARPPGQLQNADQLDKSENAAQAAKESLTIAQQERITAQDSAHAIAVINEESLRQSKHGYAADLAAFDEATRLKIESLDILEAKKEEQHRRDAQRATLVKQQQEQEASNISSFASGGQVALLRAGHNDFDAARQQLADERRLGRLDHLKSDEERAAYDAETADLQQAQNIGHDEDQQVHAIGFASRTQQAAATGRHEDRLAGVIGEISQMQEKLVSEPDEYRGQEIATQTAELQGLRQSILAPTQYATELERGTEVPGGPTGRGGTEMLDILRIIADYMKQLAQGGVPAKIS